MTELGQKMAGRELVLKEVVSGKRGKNPKLCKNDIL
jgi:hypothetical protein